MWARRQGQLPPSSQGRRPSPYPQVYVDTNPTLLPPLVKRPDQDGRTALHAEAGGRGTGPAGGRCVHWGPGERQALFLQATPHRDISRRVAAFRFELREDSRPELPPQAHELGVDGACRPCSDAEQLLVACTSDFVIRGTIHGVTHDTELQESVITVMATRVLRQTLPLFQVEGSGGQGQASIRTPLRCGVRSGPGTFLFMGWGRFGEAWLSCAPRFQEFSRAYVAAHAAHLHPCEVALD
ncbi:PREDICTED: meteorin [Galeopterus variegatus]|uniref:Meteorin n=1 Tax=Galeopterus variegatus TaxID=482537 RepID=A0ABM0R9W5_GALVR|nr:PREDICTED: meteorin [Galeopterus variegatus]